MTLCEVIEQRKSLWDVILHLKLMRWTEKLEAERAKIRNGCGDGRDDGGAGDGAGEASGNGSDHQGASG